MTEGGPPSPVRRLGEGPPRRFWVVLNPNVGWKETDIRHGVGLALLLATVALWVRGFPMLSVGALVVAFYLLLTSRIEWDPFYRIFRIDHAAAPQRAYAEVRQRARRSDRP